MRGPVHDVGGQATRSEAGLCTADQALGRRAQLGMAGLLQAAEPRCAKRMPALLIGLHFVAFARLMQPNAAMLLVLA